MSNTENYKNYIYRMQGLGNISSSTADTILNFVAEQQKEIEHWKKRTENEQKRSKKCQEAFRDLNESLFSERMKNEGLELQLSEYKHK
ncbi:hypothetical protein WKH57_25625 [Niallia taxi]|uniref:hypothetical protein n=1 Tax=Niallia taxi TaxID=2499688 RepID=UPI00316E2240